MTLLQGTRRAEVAALEVFLPFSRTKLNTAAAAAAVLVNLHFYRLQLCYDVPVFSVRITSPVKSCKDCVCSSLSTVLVTVILPMVTTAAFIPYSPSKSTRPLPAFNFSPALRCILPELLFPCCAKLALEEGNAFHHCISLLIFPYRKEWLLSRGSWP